MSATATFTGAQNPWPGSFRHTEEQAHLFFGRDAGTQELLHLIQRETLTDLSGCSGPAGGTLVVPAS
jgi:hypothetical protein